MSKEENEEKTNNEESFEETDYEAILNDGWADDVVLDYPTLDNTDDDDTESEDAFPSRQEKKSLSYEKAAATLEAARSSASRKKHGFRLFMLLWLGSLIILLALALSYFYDFLLRYEESYPASLPEREMDRIIELLATSDIDDIYLSVYGWKNCWKAL